MQRVYEDKDLKQRLSKITKAVRRDGSLLHNLFEANRDAAVVEVNGKGAGDKVFKNSLIVRVVDEAKAVTKKAIDENSTATADMDTAIIAEKNTKRKRETSSSLLSDRKPKLIIAEFKTLKNASKTAVEATIAAEKNPAILEAAAIVLAAKRRNAYRKTVRMSKGMFQRTATYICRLTGVGNTIILPPVNYQDWFKGLKGGTKTSYMQTISFARGIDTLYKTAARFGTNMVACNECYTSRECSNCRDCAFRGSGRTFTCSSCGFVTHRDAGNSVVNILIRALALGHDVNQALHNLTAEGGAGAGGGIEE